VYPSQRHLAGIISSGTEEIITVFVGLYIPLIHRRPTYELYMVKTESLVACSLKCAEQHNVCSSFRWEKDSQQCIQGWLRATTYTSDRDAIETYVWILDGESPLLTDIALGKQYFRQ